MAKEKPLFYGRLEIANTDHLRRNGTSKFIRFYFDCTADSRTITNITAHSDTQYKGLNTAMVGQTLTASSIFPNGTKITSIDYVNNSMTVEDLPAAADNGRLGRVSPALGQYYVASGSLVRPSIGVPQSAFDFRYDLTGSHDNNYDSDSGKKLVLLAVQSYTSSLDTRIDGDFSAYEVTKVTDRFNSSEASFYISASDTGILQEEPNKAPHKNQHYIIYEVSYDSSLPPLVDGETLSSFPGGGYNFAGYNVALQEYYDDLRVGIYHSSSLVEGNADFINFTGSAVKSITTASINGQNGVLIELEGGGDTFPYTGSALITGSLGITGSFEMHSGSTKPFKVNEDGTVQLFSHENSYNPTAVLGGIYFTSQSVYFGLEE